jgi:hypothetical protein
VRRHTLHRRAIEHIDRVIEHQPQRVPVIDHVQREIEPRRARSAFLGLHDETRHRHRRLARRLFEVEHHLKERRAAKVALEMKRIEHAAERCVLVLLRLQHTCMQARKQRIERHLHIGALPRRKAMRHEIESLQSEDVIEPDRAGVAHRGADHLPERLERPELQTRRIETGKTPVLPERVQRIGRRADR